MLTSLTGGSPAAAACPIRGAMLTDPGCVRTENEDCVRFVLPSGDLPGLALVADGMGGHAAGEVASAIAAKTLTDSFFSAPGGVPARLRAAFAAANAAIRAHVAAVPETAGMGTTCTVLAFAGDGVFLGHVGDSRAYLLRDGALRQISEDHSLVAQLVRDGRMTAEEAQASPDKNVILAALGLSDRVEPQLFETPLPVRMGDALLLCSDGLSDMVDDGLITAAMTGGGTPETACAALIAAAKAAGGSDNISAGVFEIGDAAQTADPVPTREVRIPDGAA
jgi:serine/threonine protein phosphatase PrpC